MVPLKYLSNFWRTLEMPLINCEVELIFTWSANSAIIYTVVANQVPTFEKAETNLDDPVVLYQPKIMQNYYHNQIQVLKEQSVGINIYRNQNYFLKIRT